MVSEQEPDYYTMSLAEIRKEKGLTRAELAERAGVSADSIYLIEIRKQVPKIDTVVNICKALEISLIQFCYSYGLDVSSIPSK